jgi:putative acetyltransferase
MSAPRPKLVVIGNGMAGMRTVEELLQLAPGLYDITVFGALKQLDAHAGEIKSMRTHPDYLRRGVAAALLEHIINQARARGLHRLSLETGSGLAFEPALALYRRHGFVNGAAFSDYQKSDFNQFLHLKL